MYKQQQDLLLIVWHPRFSQLIFLFPLTENNTNHKVPRINVCLLYLQLFCTCMGGWIGESLDFLTPITTLLPANMLLFVWCLSWRKARCRKLWVRFRRLGWREWNNWTQERSVWISITGNGQGNILVCRRWQNDQWEDVGGSCREMHSFYRQVSVGWWIPVLLPLYTLVCKPPLTSGVIL